MLRKSIILSALLFVDKPLVKDFFNYELLIKCVNDYSIQNSLILTMTLLLPLCAQYHPHLDKSHSYNTVGCSVT